MKGINSIGCTEVFYEKVKEAGSLQYEFTETQEVEAKGKGSACCTELHDLKEVTLR